MNIVLAIFMCSFIHSECIAPYVFPEKYASHYECMIAGYEKSLSKIPIKEKKISGYNIFNVSISGNICIASPIPPPELYKRTRLIILILF